MSFFKNNNSMSTTDDSNNAPSNGFMPVWSESLPGKLYKEWPKKDGALEEPVFIKHCSSIDMEDEMLLNMLHAYGIPAIKQYPSNGSFGKVVLGMSGEGTDIFVPASMLEDANSLIGGCTDDQLQE